jgi:hypothetical protein
VVAGYESHLWLEFAVAIVGAAAVLSGLLFVAMSINIERIMGIVTLPTRGAGTLVLFVIPLLIGTWILIPEQSAVAPGVAVDHISGGPGAGMLRIRASDVKRAVVRVGGRFATRHPGLAASGHRDRTRKHRKRGSSTHDNTTSAGPHRFPPGQPENGPDL